MGDFFQGKGGGLQQPAQAATTKREMSQGSMFLDFFGFFEQQNKKCLLLEGGNKDFQNKNKDFKTKMVSKQKCLLLEGGKHRFSKR